MGVGNVKSTRMQGHLGEIRLWPVRAPVPQGWRPCDGADLPISEYPLLAQLMRPYGGDGRLMFKLPDLRGKGPAPSSAPVQYIICVEGDWASQSRL